MADPVWKRKGFKNYYQYRTYLAQIQGYASYHARRVAKELFKNTGDASLLKGTDVPSQPVAPSPDSNLTRLEARGIERPSSYEFPRTHLYQHDRKVREIPNRLISRKKFDGRYAKAETITRRALPEAKRQIAKVFPDRLDIGDPNSFVANAFRAGAMAGKAPGQTVQEVADHARSIGRWSNMEDLNSYMRQELTGSVELWNRNARQWDALASKVTNAREAKRMAKQPIHGWVNDASTYRTTLANRESVLYDRAVNRAFNEGLMAAWSSRGVQYLSVIDGPECGWTSHDDPEIANGKVVTLEEALQYPVAHPFCRRSFVPIANPDEGKRRRDETNKASKLNAKTVAALGSAGVATAAAAYLGLTAEILTPNLQGTVGDIALNAIGQGLRRVLERMMAIKDRVIATLSKRFTAAGFEQRLTAIAAEIAEGEGLDPQEVRNAIVAQVHREADEFAESNAISLLTRRVIQVPAQAPARVVGDRIGLFEGYYRQTFSNEVLDGVAGADKVAELLNNQGFIHQAIFNSTRFQGKFFRFTLPRINTIEGNTGKRITSRYGRMSLAPNNLFHLHASFKPEGIDNALRMITNLKINPNGMVRMGFVKGEDGIISPNLSFVPKGPLRVYSRANRASATVKRTVEQWEWVTRGVGKQFIDEGRLVKYVDPTTGEEKAFINAVRTNIGADVGETNKVWALVRREIEVPNINRGRVNSITTEVRLITKWVPFSDSMWYKFRVNLSALGIKSPEDIKNISMYDWRRWRAKQKSKFDWLSAGVNLRLRGGNLFDFSRSLRIDPTTQYRIRNIERNADQLFSLFTEGITPEVDDALKAGKIVYDPTTGLPMRPSKVAGYRSEQALQAPTRTTTRGLLQGPGEGGMKKYLMDQYVNTVELFMRTKYLYNEASAIPTLRDELDEFVDFLETQKEKNESMNVLRALAQDRKSPWQVAQGYWSMVNKEVESRLEQLTDYLIVMQREGVVPKGAMSGAPPEIVKPVRSKRPLNVQQALKFIEEGGIDETVSPAAELYYWDKPDLITAIIQSDPTKIAKDVADRLPTLEQVRATLAQDLTTKWNQYKTLVPKQVADAVEARLARGSLLSEELGSTAEIRLNNTATLRWHSQDVDRFFKSGAAKRQGYSLREGFRPGDTLDTSDFGTIRLFDRVPESFQGLDDVSDEIVEFYIDGVSTQTWREGVPYLHGSYDVTGYTYMSRTGVGSLHPFPTDMPDDVRIVHRIYLRQKGTEVPARELVGAIVDEPVLPAVAQAERAATLRAAYPQAVDDIVEYMSRPQDITEAISSKGGTRDSLIALRLKELIDTSRNIPNNLYRVVMGQEGEDLIKQLTEQPLIKEALGTWLPSTDPFPQAGSAESRRVILVLRNGKGINATPVMPKAPPIQQFITSGAYKYARRYDDLTKNTTWIFLDYVRRL